MLKSLSFIAICKRMSWASYFLAVTDLYDLVINSPKVRLLPHLTSYLLSIVYLDGFIYSHWHIPHTLWHLIQHSFQAFSLLLSSLTLTSLNYMSAKLDVTFIHGSFQLLAFLPSFTSLLPLRGHLLNLHSAHHNFCRPIFTTWGDIFSKSSIKEITDKLELFDQTQIRKLNVKPCDCKCSPRCGCSIAWDEVVKRFHKDTLEYFDGLCFDCIKHSPRKNSKYWNRPSHQDGYDKDCRVEHGEASWYFSSMWYR